MTGRLARRRPAGAALSRAFGDAVFVVGLGAGPVMTPRPSPEPGVRTAFVADPEGNLIELLSRRADR
ncbi:hypothetical protein [Actinoplanes sp. NPDC026623]|uniref:VOC family protein n=1 Tax=Actinoplanes sp. NPDC026623 TaxID=3155610 RepID=UPI0033CD7558